ncbi:hypothetical protein B0F90DRAFT_1816471 [Multifurca ochricompacta]|uniref:Uncharacterized protein n=1 Tax=Multifurca ochricompacta TaxID=376703 RepID=A0AAD4M674_9AGAM|nr:hypothetical protein B0F90DRAFT_1816471 [Multifurca ochricompacta]
MRSLLLHVSALNEDEYDLFNSSFADLIALDASLTTDDDFEKQSVSIRETRAWLRGRYADLLVTDLDEILRLFTPNPGQESILTRGQFFAVLRLVLHVRRGAELNRNLVFKQGSCSIFTSTITRENGLRPMDDGKLSRTPHPLWRAVSLCQLKKYSVDQLRLEQLGWPTMCYNLTDVHLNVSHNDPTSPTLPVNDRPSRPVPAPPRRRQISIGGVFDTPTHHFVSYYSSLKAPIITIAGDYPAHPHHASNPFVARAAAAAAAARSNPSPERKLPPLPPRKAPPLLPPRSASLLVTPRGGTPPSKPTPPPPPAKVPHVMTALMQHSLQASKAAQEAKRIETQREQERVLQVLKSSTRSVSPPKRSGVGSGSSRSSADGAGPLLPPRTRISPPPSVTSSHSFEQVAGASLVVREPVRRSRSPLHLPSRSQSRSRSQSPSPSRPTTDLPPPVHPNRKTPQVETTAPSPTTPTLSPSLARFGRSKSVHHPSPPPIPQRRRPESVQLLSSPGSGLSPHQNPSVSPRTPLATSTSASAATSSPTFPRLARHLSLSAREPLWDDMRDTLSAVRYKAEAGFSRRGWVPGLDRDERLIAERRESGGLPSASSSEDGLGVDAESPVDEGRRGGGGPLERDEMKWPAGDGWKPLA